MDAAPHPPPTLWTPPSGLASELLPAGEHWDAVRVPGWVAGNAFGRLGEESGAVIAAPYERSLIWFVTPRATQTWELPPACGVQLFSTGQRLEVPPGWATSLPHQHWMRPWTRQCGLTDARLLHVVLDAAMAQVLGPRTEVEP